MKKIKKYKSDIISNINITPFTDVILVLLIIFMISAPSIFLSSIEIRLPKGNQIHTKLDYNYIIGIDKQGNIYYKNKKISREELTDILKEIKDNNSKILINADIETKHGNVIEIINILKEIKDNNSKILINADIETKHGNVIEIINILKNSGYSNIYVGTSK